jgi:glycosyltransferase involved in cell wall biosynthesis
MLQKFAASTKPWRRWQRKNQHPANRLPIVAEAAGGLVEQMSCGRRDIIANGMPAEDLAAAIQCFTHDPSLYETCSAGAPRRTREELGWDK